MKNYILGTDQIPDQVIWHRGKLIKYIIYHLIKFLDSMFSHLIHLTIHHHHHHHSNKSEFNKIRCINIDISNITTMSQFDIDEGTNVGDEINIICQPFILTNSFCLKIQMSK